MTTTQAVFIDFENIAIWAEHEYIELDLARILQYIQGQGQVIIKRAYGDWGAFQHYRDKLLTNSIDLIQMFALSANRNKNRADIRMAIDVLETALTRPQIERFVIISGDSDFGPLASRLREYGRQTLGIGPRKITHPLLARSCDEFVYLETILGLETDSERDTRSEQEAARQLLQKALAACEQRGELPMLTAKLKPILTSMDSTFNEADLGFGQFKDWLEHNSDIVRLYFKDMQMYAAPANYLASQEFQVQPRPEPRPAAPPAPAASISQPLSTLYKQAIERKIGFVDVQTRRDVLRDIYRELSQTPDTWSGNALIDALQARYQGQGKMRAREVLVRIWNSAFYQRAYHYGDQPVSLNSPVRLASNIDSEATFIRRAESAYVYSIIVAGQVIDCAELASALFGDQSQVEYVQLLLADLEQRRQIVRNGEGYHVAGKTSIPFHDDPELQPLIRDIEGVIVPEDQERGVAGVSQLAHSAKLLRSQDFVGAAQKYLLAGRLQWDAVIGNEAGASLDDLRWHLASYASTQAGALAQVRREYAAAQPYYLAFFWLVQEGDPLFDRMRGLINPMLSYYWANLARQAGISFTPTSSPMRTAIQIATHSDPTVRENWWASTQKLAQVNPRLLGRIAHQIRLNQPDGGEEAQLAQKIEGLLNSPSE